MLSPKAWSNTAASAAARSLTYPWSIPRCTQISIATLVVLAVERRMVSYLFQQQVLDGFSIVHEQWPGYPHGLPMD
jgi:hypothetical protein